MADMLRRPSNQLVSPRFLGEPGLRGSENAARLLPLARLVRAGRLTTSNERCGGVGAAALSWVLSLERLPGIPRWLRWAHDRVRTRGLSRGVSEERSGLAARPLHSASFSPVSVEFRRGRLSRPLLVVSSWLRSVRRLEERW